MPCSSQILGRNSSRKWPDGPTQRGLMMCFGAVDGYVYLIITKYVSRV
jgi:hypothetical protein